MDKVKKTIFVSSGFDKLPMRIEECPFYISSKDIRSDVKISYVDTEEFDRWLWRLIENSLTFGLKERFVEGMRQFEDGYYKDILSFFDRSSLCSSGFVGIEGVSSFVESGSVFVTSTSAYLLGFDRFNENIDRYAKILSCFRQQKRNRYHLTRPEEIYFGEWVPYRKNIDKVELYCIYSSLRDIDVIVYCSPSKTAGEAFSEVVIECLSISRVPKEAYPIELGIDDVADILCVSRAKVCNLISNKMIGARFLDEFDKGCSKVRIRIYDLVVYIKNMYGDEDERFKYLEKFVNNLIDTECQGLITEDCEESSSDYFVSSLGIDCNFINAVKTKIASLEKENANLEAKIINKPSLSRFGETIDAALDILFSEYSKSMADGDYKKITRKEYLALVAQKVGDIKGHASLANRIFDRYPKEYRAGPGKISR